MGTQKTLKAAVVGLSMGHAGTIGPVKPSMIHNFRQMEGVEVVAYCEETEPKLMDEAKEYHPGAHLYDSLDDLIAKEEFDVACVVLTPRDLPATCIKLAEAGKHMFMDKQFARNSAELVPLVKAVRQSGVKTFLAYPWSSHPAARDLKRMIDEGILGRPLDIESRQFSGQADPARAAFQNDTQGGGVLHYIGCHHLELMRTLMGCEVKSVQAMAGRPVGRIEEPLEDVIILGLEYENGAYGSLHHGYTKPRGMGSKPYNHGYDSALVYRGLNGWAEWTPVGSPKLEVTSASAQWSGAPERTLRYDLQPFAGYGSIRWMHVWMQSFIDDIRAGRKSRLDVEVALKILQSIDASYESARTGRRVEVEYGA